MIRLDYYNTLPARDEYISLIRSKLVGGGRFQVKSLENKSALTKTQVLCALQALIDKGEVAFEVRGKTKYFFMVVLS